MKKNSLLGFRLWSILYPLLLYWATLVIGMLVAGIVFGTGDESYILCQIVSGLIAFPVVYFNFYKPDHPGKRDKLTGRGKALVTHGIVVIVIAILCGVALNNILIMSPLAGMSDGYQEVSAKFYGSTLLLECIGTGIIAPILEELLYRGVIFGRMSAMMQEKTAAILSALIFAFMHFNIVQFLYALILGLLLAYFMVRFQNVRGAMLAHIAINLTSVIRTETGFLQKTVDHTPQAWLMTALIGAAGVGLLWLYVTKKIGAGDES